MGAYLAFNGTYLVSTATYYCKLSYKTISTGTDHGDISLAGVWLHKERFLRTSSIVTRVDHEPEGYPVYFRRKYTGRHREEAVAHGGEPFSVAECK